MSKMANLMLWAGIVVLLFAMCLPASAQAKGCKGCGDALFTFRPYEPQIQISTTPYGVVLEMLGPLGGSKLTHYCQCMFDTAGNRDHCQILTQEEPGSGDDDISDRAHGCEWTPGTPKMCTNKGCGEGLGGQLPHPQT
jgi:hypothetical protein